MLYTVSFTLLGLYLLAVALLLGDWYLLLAWPGVSFLLVGLAYMGAGPRIFGKRPDGRLAWWALLVLAPYLIPTWIVWHTLRRLNRQPASHEVAPGLWVGRRAFPHELPAGTVLVVDLTSEFPRARGLDQGRSYRCLPTLDNRAPAAEEFHALVTEVAGWPGTIYIHCALGHGRSALLAAAVVLARGLAPGPDEAVALLRRARPRIRLNPIQQDLLRRWWGERSATSLKDRP